MKKEVYDNIMRTRIAVARVLFRDYKINGVRVLVEELPQPVVQAFDILTQMLRDEDDTEYRTFFESWWVNIGTDRMNALELQIDRGSYER